MTPARSGPHGASHLTAPFWAAAREEQLVRPYCRHCDRSFFTPQLACPGCLAGDWTWEPSSGLGAVSAYTVVHRGPDRDVEVPYIIAIVDLDEGWHMLTNLVGLTSHDLVAGLRVRVCWRPTADPAVVLPMFEPDPGAGG